MKTCLSILTATMLLFITPEINAQTYFGTQANGIGIRQFSPSVRGMGIGGAGFASSDSLSLGNYVISQWRKINVTRMSLLMNYQRISTELPELNYKTATAGFGGLNIAIPIIKNQWVFGLSVRPYTRIDYKFEFLVPFATSDSTTGYFNEIAEARGSITQAQFNLVWSPISQIGLAVHGNFYFGLLEDVYNFQFSSSANGDTLVNNPDYVDAIHDVQYRVNGLGIGFSMDLQPIKQLHLAGFVDFKPGMRINTDYTSFVDNLPDRERSLDAFPAHYGFGAALELRNDFVLESNYSYQDLKKALNATARNFGEWSSLNFGLEKKASRNRRSSFLNRFDWRTGLSLSKVGYLFNDESVDQRAVHLGFGIPFGNYSHRIDFAVVAGRRGDSDKNLASENFIDLHVGISLGEKWFQRIR